MSPHRCCSSLQIACTKTARNIWPSPRHGLVVLLRCVSKFAIDSGRASSLWVIQICGALGRTLVLSATLERSNPKHWNLRLFGSAAPQSPSGSAPRTGHQPLSGAPADTTRPHPPLAAPKWTEYLWAASRGGACPANLKWCCASFTRRAAGRRLGRTPPPARPCSRGLRPSLLRRTAHPACRASPPVRPRRGGR